MKQYRFDLNCNDRWQWHHRLLSLLPVILFLLLVTRAAATPPLLDELRAATSEWVSDAGSVIFTYESTHRAGRQTIGFDPATGAWFSADHVRVSGRTADGTAYFGTPDIGKVQPLEDQASRIPVPVQDFIPLALPVALIETTASLIDITRDAESNWVIEYVTPGPDPENLPHGRMIISKEGLPLRTERDADPASGRKEVAYDYEFEPESAKPLLIAKRKTERPKSGHRKLVDVQYYNESRPDLFTIEAVEAIGIDNRMMTAMRLNEITVQGQQEGYRPGDPPPPARYVQHWLTHSRWPLIVTGLIVVGIGVFVLIRARSGR